VVVAVHHAGEALALLAETEHGQLRAAAHASRQATIPIGRAADATGAPSRVLTTARAAITATPLSRPGRQP
jgi:hypothetical protein